jgi:hypothetical protein
MLNPLHTLWVEAALCILAVVLSPLPPLKPRAAEDALLLAADRRT